jgi:hypothetical protein
MIALVLTLLVCLLLSAAVGLFVAYPGRGRPLPESLTSRLPAQVRPSRQPASSSETPREAQEARS